MTISVIIETQVTVRCCLVLKGASVDAVKHRPLDTEMDPSTILVSLAGQLYQGLPGDDVCDHSDSLYCFVAAYFLKAQQ